MKIEINNSGSVVIDGTEYMPKPKMHFTTPGWFHFENEMGLFYATHQDGDYLKDGKGGMWHIDHVRSATTTEIEAHLRKICKERYENKRVKSLYEQTGYSSLDNLYYVANVDEMHDGYLTLYRKGQWAETIPDKKPLPKTKEEYLDFLLQWRFDIADHDAFLDQYDFNNPQS